MEVNPKTYISLQMTVDPETGPISKGEFLNLRNSKMNTTLHTTKFQEEFCHADIDLHILDSVLIPPKDYPESSHGDSRDTKEQVKTPDLCLQKFLQPNPDSNPESRDWVGTCTQCGKRLQSHRPMALLAFLKCIPNSLTLPHSKDRAYSSSL